MAVPAKQSKKSIYHDSSEDHGSSPGDPEPICGDWEEYSSYTSSDTNCFEPIMRFRSRVRTTIASGKA
jgi:hypothetical protein